MSVETIGAITDLAVVALDAYEKGHEDLGQTLRLAVEHIVTAHYLPPEPESDVVLSPSVDWFVETTE
jgi:hypothetical protein